MKKSSMNALFIVLIFFSLSFTFYSVSFAEIPSKQEIGKEDLKNLHDQISLIDDLIDWIPIESILGIDDNSDKQIVDNPTTTIAYDSINNLEILEDNDNNDNNNDNDVQTREFNQQIEEYEGLLDINYGLTDTDEEGIKYVFPPDDRERVTSTSSFPWSSICKLYITAQTGSRYIASGFIIDNFHVLTCGHCAYLHGLGGWADEIIVVPGQDDFDRPFGHAVVTYMRSYTGWIESEMVEHDWALLTLDRSVGNFTGWMGRQTADSSSSIYTGILNTAGYPGDLDNGEIMYFVSDNGDRADEYNHWFWMDSAGGQSGSPIWIYDGENRYVLSILAYEYEYGSDANFGTRLNSDKYNQINTWLENDSSTPPNDRADLLEGDSYSSFSTTDVVSGQTNFEIYCDVKNSGTATALNFRVNFYASEDLNISLSDHLIGTKDIYNLQPFNSSSADWIGVFPSEIPEGYYYIGLIIDSVNSIDEINENNNNVIISNTQIVVRKLLSIIDSIPIIIGVSALVGIILAIGLIVRAKVRRTPDLDYRMFSDKDVRKSVVFQEYERSYSPRFCRSCGTESVEGALFCINCGNDLRKINR